MSLQDLYVFSSNPKKLTELQGVFAGVRVDSLARAVRSLPEVVEDGQTFEANARKKALAGAQACGAPTIADDSGLEVDALGGQPGVWSDRFAIQHGRIQPGSAREERTRANNSLLLELLEARETPSRVARFVCALCCALPEDLVSARQNLSAGVTLDTQSAQDGWVTVTVRGICEGRITKSAQGSGGFGYDPLFWSDDLDKTFGQATASEKQAVSHRGRAAQEMVRFLAGEGLI